MCKDNPGEEPGLFYAGGCYNVFSERSSFSLLADLGEYLRKAGYCQRTPVGACPGGGILSRRCFESYGAKTVIQSKRAVPGTSVEHESIRGVAYYSDKGCCLPESDQKGVGSLPVAYHLYAQDNAQGLLRVSGPETEPQTVIRCRKEEAWSGQDSLLCCCRHRPVSSGDDMQARIVFVRDRRQHRKWLALLTLKRQ